MNVAFSIVLLFILLDCVMNEKPPCAKGCHVPLTAFYRPVKALTVCYWTVQQANHIQSCSYLCVSLLLCFWRLITGGRRDGVRMFTPPLSVF